MVLTLWFLYPFLTVRELVNLQEGLARLERKKRWDTKERQTALENLEEHQKTATESRLGIWQYGHVDSDDEESVPQLRKVGGRR